MGWSGWDYVQRFHLRKRLEPYAFYRGVWAAGGATRGVMLALVIAGVAAAVLLNQRAEGVAWAEVALQVMAVVFLLLAWSVASAAAASGVSAWVFPLVATWLIQTAILATTAWKLTPVMAFAPWVLIGLGWWSSRAAAVRWHGWLGWALWTVLAGVTTAGPSGFRAALGWSRPTGMAAMGALIGGLGLVAWWVTRRRIIRPPGFGEALVIAMLAIGAPLALSWHRDRAELNAWVPELFIFVSPLVFLFWMWTGSGLALGIFKMADWTIGRLARLNLTHLALWMFPLALAIGLAVEWFVAYGPAQAAAGRLPATPTLHLALQRAHQLPFAHWYACWWHFWVTLGVIVVAAVARWRGRLRFRFILDLAAAWIVSYFVLLAFVGWQEKVRDLASLPADGSVSRPAPWWTLGGLTALVLLDLPRVRKNWSRLSPEEIRTQLGWMIVVVAFVLCGHITKGDRAAAEEFLSLIYGLLHFGLIRAAYSRLRGKSEGPEGVPVLGQMGLALAGFGLGWILIALPGGAVASAVAGLVGGSVLLALWRWQRPAWDPLSGALAGGLLGAAACYYFLTPFPLSLPFIGGYFLLSEMMPAEPSSLNLEARFGLTTAASAALAAIGYAVFRFWDHRSEKRSRANR